MKLLLELSREHPTLPEAELAGVLEGEQLDYIILWKKENTIFLDADTRSTDFIGRLALTKHASEILYTTEKLGEHTERLYKRISQARSFRVKSHSKKVEGKLGGLIAEHGIKVDLTNPDITVTCDLMDGRYLVGLEIPLERGFEERKPQHRPYFHPTSMHPKTARALVNLARIKEGDTILDPFCGTGGILVEAGLLGLKVVGRDVDQEMVEGCGKNLKFYGLSGDIEEGDALKYEGKVDAIVTDPPYGRSSYSTEKNLGELYKSFVDNAGRILESEKHMVLVLPAEVNADFKGFEVEGSYDIRVHKSLTRRIWVLKRS